jgi:hypothetical protein
MMAYLPLSGQVEDTARGAHDDMRLLIGEFVSIELDVNTSIEDDRLDIGQILGKALVLPLDLEGQLSGVAEHQHRHLTAHRHQLV